MTPSKCLSCGRSFGRPDVAGPQLLRRCEPCEEAARNAPTDAVPRSDDGVVCEARVCVGQSLGGHDSRPEAVGSFALGPKHKRLNLCASCLRIARDSVEVVSAEMAPEEESTPIVLEGPALTLDAEGRAVLAGVIRDRLAIDNSLTAAVRAGDIPLGADMGVATMTIRRLPAYDRELLTSILRQLAPAAPQPDLPWVKEGKS